MERDEVRGWDCNCVEVWIPGEGVMKIDDKKPLNVATFMLLFSIVAIFVGYTIQQIGRERQEFMNSPDCVPEVNCITSDLRAQFRAARAAEINAEASLWQLGLAIGGTIFVGVGLVLNATATQAAVAAALAGQDQAKTSLEMQKRTLRAYVAVETGPTIELQLNGQPRVSIRMHNVGQTPAHRVTARIAAIIQDKNNIVSVSTIEPEDFDPLGEIIHAGKARISRINADFSILKDGIDGINSSDCTIYVHGCVIYDDAFGERYFTKFVHAWNGNPPQATYVPGFNVGT